MAGRKGLKVFILLTIALRAFSWHDDLELNLRDPFELFSSSHGISYLGGAIAEVKLGRFFHAPDNLAWSGGALGDVSLLTFGDFLYWHIGLSMETLADDQNDIKFRLVQVYYRAVTGLSLRLYNGALELSYRHRCSHGADRAVISRITIRSGPLVSYHWQTSIDRFTFDVMSGITAYVLGQNSDLLVQPKGGSFLTLQAASLINRYFSLVAAFSINAELMSSGNKIVYGLFDHVDSVRVLPLFGLRTAFRVTHGMIKNDFALRFTQNFDNAMGTNAHKSNNFLLDVDFMW